MTDQYEALLQRVVRGERARARCPTELIDAPGRRRRSRATLTATSAHAPLHRSRTAPLPRRAQPTRRRSRARRRRARVATRRQRCVPARRNCDLDRRARPSAPRARQAPHAQPLAAAHARARRRGSGSGRRRSAGLRAPSRDAQAALERPRRPAAPSSTSRNCASVRTSRLRQAMYSAWLRYAACCARRHAERGRAGWSGSRTRSGRAAPCAARLAVARADPPQAAPAGRRGSPIVAQSRPRRPAVGREACSS